MSIRNKNGIWYYEFMAAGRRYCGTCLDESGNPTGNERTAATYEKAQKEICARIRSNKSVKALAENFREELTGARAIPLAEAFERSLAKPRKRKPCSERLALKRGHWQDFLRYMEDTYPEVTHLAAVSRHHAENYVASLVTFGKFEPRQAGQRRIAKPLSGATLTDYITTITEVFTLLADDAGLLSNPFSGIPKPSLRTETRLPFTLEELQVIRENLDDFTRPLFTIAIATALREGDICTLKWSEIDFKQRVIRRQKMRKTGEGVDIPIMPPLQEYLEELRAQAKETGPYAAYVLPKHAEMYLSNRSGVSYRIKNFLEEKCHIRTTVKPEGRSRAVSVKDLHSCRHSFCYYAGLYGIPMNIVQGIVGHLTPEMTKLYSNHASLEAKREKMQQLPAFLNLAGQTKTPASDMSCASDPEILPMLRKIPIRYTEEVKMLLEYIAAADSAEIVTLRRQLAG